MGDELFLYEVRDKQGTVVASSEWWTDYTDEEFSLFISSRSLRLADIARPRIQKEIMIHATAELLKKHSPFVQNKIGINHLHDYLPDEECATFGAAFLADNPEQNDNPFDRELSLMITEGEYCFKCKKMFPPDDIVCTEDSKYVCRDCLDKVYVLCDGCGGYFRKKQIKKNDNGMRLCKVCLATDRRLPESVEYDPISFDDDDP